VNRLTMSRDFYLLIDLAVSAQAIQDDLVSAQGVTSNSVAGNTR
jgi:hypothetical protein